VLATNKLTTHSQRSWIMDLLFLAIFLGGFYAIWIGSYALFTPDEGRYSEVAREMVASGDYITPRLNGVAFLDKPILYYWLQASAIKLFGLSEGALRFWPSVIGVLGCLVTYIAGRQLFNRRTGLLAAIILALCPLYYGAAHYANLDLEISVFISCSLLFFLLGIQRQAFYLLPAYIFCGLAVLTKGLIGLAFPVMIVGLWIILSNRWSVLKNLRLFSGFLIFAAITVPWYWLVQKANPQFLHFFFVTQQVTRFLGKADFNNRVGIWFYIPIVLAGCVPWAIFLIQALTKNIKIVWRDRHAHTNELFLLLWFFIVFIFFSIPKSKTVGYILPIFPALALIIGHYLNYLWDKKSNTKRIFQYCTIVAMIFLLTLIASAPLLNKKSAKSLAEQLTPILKPQDEVVIFYKYYQDLPLYLQRKVTIVADWHASDIPHNDNWLRELWYGMPFQDTQSWLIEEPNFWQRWSSNKRLFVFVNSNVYPQFAAKATGSVYKLGESHGIVLVSNSP
jgi:4-amino-4-deoxy-L-arabinose transferase-like glycosyltransferase